MKKKGVVFHFWKNEQVYSQQRALPIRRNTCKKIILVSFPLVAVVQVVTL